jgi:hypothetical protein
MSTRKAMRWLCLACGVCLAGCSTLPAVTPMVRKMANEAKARAPVAPEMAQEAVKPGVSTRADLLAALGETSMVRFDSGYEVWVYRFAVADSKQQGEYVVLIAPSGLVAKARTRLPAPPIKVSSH